MSECLLLSSTARMIAVLSFCSLKVDVCAAVSGVGIPSFLGKQSWPRSSSIQRELPEYCAVGSVKGLGLKRVKVSDWPRCLLCTELRADLQLDWLKGARGGVKRVLFLDTQEPQRTVLLRLGHRHPRACLTHTIYLKVSTGMPQNQPTVHHAGYIYHIHEKRTMLHFLLCCQEDDEFRDKLTPISLALNYSLAPPSHGRDLPPILNHYSSTFLQEQVSSFE